MRDQERALSDPAQPGHFWAVSTGYGNQSVAAVNMVTSERTQDGHR